MQITMNLFRVTLHHIKNIIKESTNETYLLDHIDEPKVRFLTNKYPRVSIFYALLKVSYSGLATYRRNWLTIRKLAKYVDQSLNSLVCQIPSYIEYTKHFIKIIENLEIFTISLLVTLDVGALYVIYAT